MKDRIEQMPKNYQIEIARILINKHQVSYDENQNGLFINLTKLTSEIHPVIQQFITYVDLQEQQLRKDEVKKDGLKDIFFNHD